MWCHLARTGYENAVRSELRKIFYLSVQEMTKQTQASQPQPEYKNGHKPEPAVIPEQANDTARMLQPMNAPGGANSNGDMDFQAARLNNGRLQIVQRQDMAQQISQVQGNQHLQRLLHRGMLKKTISSHATSSRDHVLQRRVSSNYGSMKDNLSYGVFDWAVTDEDAHQVLDWLRALSSPDLTDTILELERDGYLDRLLDNISESDRVTYATLIQNIQRARSVHQTAAHLQSLLSYGILDWAITDEEAHEVLINLQNMPDDRRKMVVYRLEENGYYQRLIDNISAADQTAFAGLISDLNRIKGEYRDQMQGTSAADPSAQHDVEALLTPGIVRDPVTGAPAAFVDIVGGKTYRQDIEQKLDQVRAWMLTQAQALLGHTRLPMTRFEGVGAEAKRQTDALFGRYASGPAFRAGTRAAGANLIDRSLQTPDAADLTRYLIHNQAEVLPIHPLHSAIPSRAAESAIINAIITDYSAAHLAELEVIDRAWPAVAGGGIVEIQPFEGDTPAETRRTFWETFQTMIHEYLHTITHQNYSDVADSLGETQDSILTEGGTSLFTDDVWNAIYPDEIRANADLRANVEGSALPFDDSVIPPISHYDQIAQARDIRSRVGAENMRAAYFLGHTELIGLGPTWTATSAARGETFVIPSSGVHTVADVANVTGASATAIATANGISVSDPVTSGQELTVPGIRIHIVLPGGTETKPIIARRNGVTEAQLERANPGVNWAALTQGQRIVIPAH
jgi:hypothetical protein